MFSAVECCCTDAVVAATAGVGQRGGGARSAAAGAAVDARSIGGAAAGRSAVGFDPAASARRRPRLRAQRRLRGTRATGGAGASRLLRRQRWVLRQAQFGRCESGAGSVAGFASAFGCISSVDDRLELGNSSSSSAIGRLHRPELFGQRRQLLRQIAVGIAELARKIFQLVGETPSRTVAAAAVSSAGVGNRRGCVGRMVRRSAVPSSADLDAADHAQRAHRSTRSSFLRSSGSIASPASSAASIF